VSYLGIIIIALSLLSIGIFVIIRNVSWKNKRPKESYKGCFYEFLPGTVVWEDFRQTLNLLQLRLDADVLSDLWIRVLPYESVVRSPTCLTGFIDAIGQSTPEPPDEPSAAGVRIIMGVTEVERKWPIGRATLIIYARQHKPSDNAIQARLRTGVGNVVDTTAKSVLVHELVQHVYSYRKGKGLNQQHSSKELIDLERRILR
jgi:hypothetical protein